MIKRMRSMLGPIFGLMVGVGSLSGCGSSPPTQFITLSPNRGAAAADQQGQKPVMVGKVDLPPELDRLPLVSFGSGGKIEVDGSVRWAAPLGETVRRTLAVDLAARLGRDHVVLPGQPRPPGGVRTVVVTIEQFAPEPGGQVNLFADWSLVESGTHRVLVSRHASLHAQAKSTDSTQLAAAMSEAVAKLSDQIAVAVTGKRHGKRP